MIYKEISAIFERGRNRVRLHWGEVLEKADMTERILAGCLLLGVLMLPAGAQTQVDLRTQGKDVDFSASGSTKPFRMGAALPATCAIGEAFFNAAAPAGQNVYACTATNVWSLEGGNGGIPSVTGNADAVLSNNGTAADWRVIGGDISGPLQAVIVGGIQGRSIAATAPSDGQLLRWDAGASQWGPYSAAAATGANYSQTFTNQTTITMAGSAHGLGTANLIVACYDTGSPSRLIEPDSVSVNTTTFDVTVNFATAQSGRCVINGSGASNAAATNLSNTFPAGTVQTFQGALVASGADRTAPAKSGTSLPPSCTTGDQFFKTDATPGQNLYFCTGTGAWTQMSGTGGGGAVASVFGRTGTVAAQSGDYSFPQISGTISDSQVATGINATKIGAGTVSNTAFGYLANVSSDVQAQLNSKAAANQTYTVGGDVAGNIASETVVGIQGRQVSTASPLDGQALVWSAVGNTWQPGAAAGGGAGMASQLNDFGVTQTSATVLTIGAYCSTATPCNVRFGNTVYSFTHSYTATIAAGTGTAYVYIASGGTLTIGHNLTVTASTGSVAQPSVTFFPVDSIPLYTWTATNGTWDATGGRDQRAWLSLKNLSAGTGVTTVESGGRTTVGVDTALVPTYLTATAVIDFPAIANGACASDQTFTLPGANTGDAALPGWPSGLEAGLVGIMRVSASNTIAVRLCNLSGATLDPASATFRATIVRSF